jgi:hypothetical protein
LKLAQKWRRALKTKAEPRGVPAADAAGQKKGGQLRRRPLSYSL